jgi:carboxymethylenebutenolidase
MVLTQERREISVDGGSMPVFACRLEGSEPLPAIVVIHEILGLTPHHEDIACRFAGEGFVAAAPNLFFDIDIPNFTDRASFMAFRQQIDDRTMVERVRALVTDLRQRPDVHADAIGVVGYCFGGYTALLATADIPEIKALADYYGGGNPETVHAAARKVRVPVLGMFGGEDQGIPVEVVRETERILKGAGNETQFHVYPGAGHAFFNDTSADRYRPDAARDAWPKTVDFFKRTLKVASSV